MRPLIPLLLVASTVAIQVPALCIAATDTATAQANRKKPLQRCDQLKGEAELECLKKARERVVEARSKRESKGSAETTSAR